MKQFIKQMLSGANGVVSSKRIIGALTMLVVLGCIIYLTIHEGCTEGVENIMLTLIISACSLLGITSVANVWRKPPTDQFNLNL